MGLGMSMNTTPDKPHMPLAITQFDDNSIELQLGQYKTTLHPNTAGEFNFIDLDQWCTHVVTKEAEKYKLRQQLMGK